MMEYKSYQSVKQQKEQKQSLLKKESSLRLETTFENKNKAKLKTELRQKRKLLVYKKDGKFYIDNSAAYALQLTNVRSIMTENSYLIEIGIEVLYKFQNDANIEIVYQELNKEKEIKDEKYDLIKFLNGLEVGEYGIGIHGVDKGNSEEKQGIASNISNVGLDINNNTKTILSTAISLGLNDDMQKICLEISGYKFGNGAKVNVVIAVPLYIQNQSGEKIFLGFPSENKSTAGQQYDEHCILDRICAKMKKIPPQFILGYYFENQDGKEIFIRNEQHYSTLTLEDREKVFTALYSNMDDISKNYNDLIASGNIEQLVQIKGRMQQLGWNSSLIDNALLLAQKYKEQAVSQDIGKRNIRQINLNTNKASNNSPGLQEKNVRRVILDHSLSNENPSNSTKSRRTRKILLDAYKEVLKLELEKIEEQESDYKKR